jgi:hypothetical protein
MKTYAALSISVLVVLLTACGSEPPVPASSDSARPHSYSEATVDSFISRCLGWSGASVGRCACILDEHRKTLSETAFLASLSAAQSSSRTAIFRGCGLADLAAVTPATAAAAEPESAAALVPPVGAASSGVSPPTTAPTTVRAATDTEACVQQKLIEAQAAAGGGSVPLKKLDSIRAECS